MHNLKKWMFWLNKKIEIEKYNCNKEANCLSSLRKREIQRKTKTHNIQSTLSDFEAK